MFDSLQLHGLQHTRVLHPPLSPGVCSTHVHWVSDAINPSHPLMPFILLPSVHRESIFPILPTIWNSHHTFCFPLFTYLSEFPLLWLWVQRHCFGLLPYFPEKAIANINFANTHIYILLSTSTHCNGFVSQVSKNFHVVCWYILLIQLLPSNGLHSFGLIMDDCWVIFVIKITKS